MRWLIGLVGLLCVAAGAVWLGFFSRSRIAEAVVWSWQERPVASCNADVTSALARGETWPTSSRDVACRCARTCGGASVDVVESRDGLAEASIRRSGFQDDSVWGGRWQVWLRRRPAGDWEVLRSRRAWSCRHGRGHLFYSASPCA